MVRRRKVFYYLRPRGAAISGALLSGVWHTSQGGWLYGGDWPHALHTLLEMV